MHRSCGRTRVDGILTGSDEIDDSQIFLGSELLSVMLRELTRHFLGYVKREGHFQARISAGFIEADRVILQPERLVTVSAGHIRDRGSHDNSQIIDRQLRLSGGD
jgi:hypothetical protein